METCFICGKSADTEEHIFPKWLQQKYNLWNQKLKLVNQSTINYKELKIPCCSFCNNELLSVIEKHIKSGSANDEEIWKWAAKIHFGILRKDDFLDWDRKNPKYKIGEIIRSDDPLEIDRHIIHSIHGEFKTDPNPFGSVYRFSFEKESEYYFVHLLDPPAICISIGKIGYVVFIKDAGLLSRTSYAQKLHTIHASNSNVGKMLNFFANAWIYFSSSTVSIALILYRNYIAVLGSIDTYEKRPVDINSFKKLWKFINHGIEGEITINKDLNTK